MLTVSNVAFEYTETSILSKINFTVPLGTILHIRGANGAGKTTLLKLLAGILQPYRGNVYYCNQSIYDVNSLYKCCYIGHKLGIYSQLSANEHYTMAYKTDLVLLNQIITQLDLTKVANTKACQLSFGQKRRCALLRLALDTSPVWLLDEPFVGLDTSASMWLSTCIQEHIRNHGITIVTSHQPLPTDLSIAVEYML